MPYPSYKLCVVLNSSQYGTSFALLSCCALYTWQSWWGTCKAVSAGRPHYRSQQCDDPALFLFCPIPLFLAILLRPCRALAALMFLLFWHPCCTLHLISSASCSSCAWAELGRVHNMVCVRSSIALWSARRSMFRRGHLPYFHSSISVSSPLVWSLLLRIHNSRGSPLLTWGLCAREHTLLLEDSSLVGPWLHFVNKPVPHQPIIQ